MIPYDDRGLLLGDGVFETLKAQDGVLLYFGDHFARLTKACHALGLPAPSYAQMGDSCMACLDETEAQAVRFTYTAGSGGRGLTRPISLNPRYFATSAPLAPAPLNLALGLSLIRRNESSPTSRHKTLNYLDNIMARRQAIASGYDDALMLNTQGEIACSTAGNLFWCEDGVITTPDLSCGVLEGLTRGRLIKAAEANGLRVQEVKREYHLNLVLNGLMVCNSLIGLVPVTRLEGQAISPSKLMDDLKSLAETRPYRCADGDRKCR
jgi:branched-subunit amino acid aminotransferase/4-amino-4-deoxychorismate lyase